MAQRITNQRMAILAFLKDNKKHPTAAQVFDSAAKHLPHISKATVYRNLDALCKENLIRAVPIAGVTRYEEVEEGSHDHFVCTNCDAIIDVHMEKLDAKALSELTKAHPSLRAQEVIINWSGICPDCGGT